MANKNNGGKSKIGKLAKGKALHKKLDKFLNVWKAHVKHELRLHHHMRAGKKTLAHHVKQSIVIHKKLLEKLRKL